MNFQYNLYQFNAKSLIGYYSYLLDLQESNTILNTKFTRYSIDRIKTHYENAFFYQLLKCTYLLSENPNFSKDRIIDSSIDPSSFNKKFINTLKNTLIYIDFEGVFTEQNIIKRKKYPRIFLHME